MDDSRFDDAIRTFARRFTRRGAGHVLTFGIGAAIIDRATKGPAVSARPRRKNTDEGRSKRRPPAERGSARVQAASEGLSIEWLNDGRSLLIYNQANRDGAYKAILKALSGGWARYPTHADYYAVFENGQHLRDVYVVAEYGHQDGTLPIFAYGVESSGEAWRFGLLFRGESLDRVVTASLGKSCKKKKGKKGKKCKKIWKAASRLPSLQRTSTEGANVATRADVVADECRSCDSSCSSIAGLSLHLFSDYHVALPCGIASAGVCGANFLTCVGPVFSTCQPILDSILGNPGAQNCESICSQEGSCAPCESVSCSGGQVLNSSTCACECPSGPGEQLFCGGQCVNVRTNSAHCGACNRPCGTNEICQNSQCQTACALSGPFTGVGWPFDPDDGQWFIFNGYRGHVDHGVPNDPTLKNTSQRFGLDFAKCLPDELNLASGACGEDQSGRDVSATANSRVYSPVTGQILFNTDAVGIRVAGASDHVIVLAHVVVSAAQGSCVAKNQDIGHVSGGTNAHIHMSLYERVNGGDDQRTPVPFDGQWAIDACYYPDDGTRYQYQDRIAPCGSLCGDGSCGCPGGHEACDGVCVPLCSPGQTRSASCRCSFPGGTCPAGTYSCGSAECAGGACTCGTTTEGESICFDQGCGSPCTSSNGCLGAAVCVINDTCCNGEGDCILPENFCAGAGFASRRLGERRARSAKKRRR